MNFSSPKFNFSKLFEKVFLFSLQCVGYTSIIIFTGFLSRNRSSISTPKLDNFGATVREFSTSSINIENDVHMELMKVLLEMVEPKACAMERDQFHGMDDSIQNQNGGIVEMISYTTATMERVPQNYLFRMNRQLLPYLRNNFLEFGNEICQATHRHVWAANHLLKTLKYTLNGSLINNGRARLNLTDSRKVYY